MHKLSSGNSSVGRARPCQGRGRGFESRFPLNKKIQPREWLFCLLSLYFNIFPIGMPFALLLAFYFYLFTFVFLLEFYPARVAELVDALDLKSSGLLVRGGSSPPPGTAKAPKIGAFAIIWIGIWVRL